MPKYRDFAPGVPFPSTWADALEEMVSTMASGNFRLSKLNDNTIQIVAGAGNDQVTIGINGKPRWITATINAAVPGGAAGFRDVWVTTGIDTFSVDGDGDETDTTDHSFGLKVTAVGTTPTGVGAETHYRKVGQVYWNGSIVEYIRQGVGPTNDPTGPAGGDLAGSMYPNPVVSVIDGKPVNQVVFDDDARLSKKFWTPHTWALPGDIRLPVGETDFVPPFFVPIVAGQTVKLVAVMFKLNAGGTVDIKLQRNGIDLAGFAGQTGTAGNTLDPADVALAHGDRLGMVVTGVNAAPKNLTVSVFLEHTV